MQRTALRAAADLPVGERCAGPVGERDSSWAMFFPTPAEARVSSHRRLSIAVLLLLGLGFLAATHAYLARRLVLDPGVPEPWRTAALAAIALLGASVVLHPVAERRFPRALARLVAWPASIWMGLAFLLLVQLLATDALLGLAGAAAQA